MARQQVADGVAQHALFIGEFEIHGRSHNPRIVDAMMVRCTSLDPP